MHSAPDSEDYSPMRKTAIPVLVLCLLLALSVAAMAKELKGAVTATNDNSVTVKGKTADETFWINDKTKFEKDHKKAALSDVRVGEWVEVHYATKAGKSWITKLEIEKPHKGM